MAISLDKLIVSPFMVGNSRYFERLVALFRQAVGGKGQVILVEGEAGIGKTRLVAEAQINLLAAGLSPVPQTLGGRCFEPERTRLYAPLVDMLAGYLQGDLEKLLLASPAIALLFPQPGPAQPPPLLDYAELDRNRFNQALARNS